MEIKGRNWWNDLRQRSDALGIHPRDDAVSDLDIPEYLELRLAWKLREYRAKLEVDGKWRKIYELGVYVMNALATAFVVIGEEVWVSTLVALLGALGGARGMWIL